MISNEDRRILQVHLAMIRQVEQELQTETALQDKQPKVGHAVPKLPPNVQDQNDNMPQITRMQMDLLVNSLVADFARVATFQITNSVGQPRMSFCEAMGHPSQSFGNPNFCGGGSLTWPVLMDGIASWKLTPRSVT